MNSQSRTPSVANQTLRVCDAVVYQIRVQSCLDDHWADWFEGMELTRDEARNTTTLTGTLPDQAALHGILARIRDLGLPLVSLACLDKKTRTSEGLS
jgi:hypothetical protein